MRTPPLADDPRGLIQDAYLIPDIPAPECRSIFLDWAMELREPAELRKAAARLLQIFEPENHAHPMNDILKEACIAVQIAPVRRGGRKARAGKNEGY